VTPETLRATITASGLSQVEWARTVAGRDPRTVRRWLAGETIPPTTADWLARLVSMRVSATSVTTVVSR
jgi:DNA-binding transcriptional regulator YiaG